MNTFTFGTHPLDSCINYLTQILKDIKGLYNYGFGYVSATNDYKVVVAAQLNGPNDISDRDHVEVFSLRANSWKKVQALILSNESNQSALSNKALHWLHTLLGPYGYTQVVIAFDLANEEFQEVMLPNFEEDRISLIKVEALLEGFLCAWGDEEPDFQCIEIWVMREYDVCES
ncbi:PREDICTED: F-box protein CPR30 [Prunus mume]|uniref:F-box protein CPR30 n=1 Tax=Prunus mume TaxID=102107 RepID=A0ABM1LJ25_PRUMU|nr:PREDICTED: F-box protein CPR30 [Prunus mume]